MKKLTVMFLALAMLLATLSGGALAETTERQTVNFWYLWTGVEAEGMEQITLISDMVEQVIVGTYSVDECVEQIMTEYEYLY